MPAQIPSRDVLGPERLELLAKVASLYFENDMTQTEIASRTGYSPSMVSRLLSEARKYGIVEFRVHHPIERRVDLEQELMNRLGLNTVRVVVRGSLDHLHMLRRLGSVAARLVEDIVHDNMIIGIAWGPAVYQTVNDLRRGLWSNVQVVQLIGSLGTSEPEVDGQELARRMANSFGGRYTALLAPGVFVIITTDQPKIARDLKYLGLSNHGDYWALYRPYHLANLEAPISIAHAVLDQEVTLATYRAPVAETVACAKRDLIPGEKIDSLGGYTVYGFIERAETARAEQMVPIGLVVGATMQKPVAAGQPIRSSDVAMNEKQTIVRLRSEQDQMLAKTR